MSDAIGVGGAFAFKPYPVALLAESLLGADRVEEAAALFDEMLPLIEEMGSHFYEAEVLRLEGEQLLMTGERDEGEHVLNEALEAARADGAKNLERRAAESLRRMR